MADRPTMIRQWQMLRQLSASRVGVCIRELAAEYEDSEKTIRRDLDALTDGGFELLSTSGTRGQKQWRLEGSSEFAPLHFDIEEIASLYLVALSPERLAPRHYLVDRIHDVEVLPETFTRPPDFDLKQRPEHSLGIYQSDAPLTDVGIRFSADAARYVTEHRWHDSQQIEEQPDGSLLVDLKLSDLTEAKSWVLSFGASAAVLEPESLRDTIHRQLLAALTSYRTDSVAPIDTNTSEPTP